MWLLSAITIFAILNYHRAALSIWALSYAIFLCFITFLSDFTNTTITITWAIYLILFAPLLILPIRRKLISAPILNFYRKAMPSMSRTEREALAAGTVSWEGELFCGAPNWKTFLKLPAAKLTVEEQAFLNGPTEELCTMLNDWEITHDLADLPAHVWKFIKDEGFFSLIIPKQYGGKEFSAYAQSQVLTKIYSRCSTAATTVGVPNSLGPAELLLHYGTEEQKNYYLPRLAKGEEVPCFALTGPEAGSDAGAMQDYGVVCYQEYNGKKTLGIRLNFDKRYITLAPVATVIGLAFKLFDPDHLIGSNEDIGITCALIPRDTPNMQIGRRHFPCNIPFQNGPIHGKNVFIPMDWVIGGKQMVGHGWRMLMECLAAGRAITLPASSCGGTKTLSYATSAYCRIRKQFKVAIGKFEGVEEALGRMIGLTYIIDAARTFAAAAIDTGQKPAIASAIIKYHTTEMGRIVANDGMDIHGGKGICLGPHNYIGRGYQSVPIAITVEGANILTRNMIIFGQGAMRCHPYLFAEMQAAKMNDKRKGLVDFDKAINGHLSYTISNIVRSLLLSITSGLIASTPSGKLKRYYQQTTRFSAAFALISDMSLLLLGGSLKRKENISARLGDILSYLYLISAVLKHYIDQGSHENDLPIVRWTLQYCFYQIQERFKGLLDNYPNKVAAFFLKLLIFPFGMNFKMPSDKLTRKVAHIIQQPSYTRDRLTHGIFLANTPNNPLAALEDALVKTIATEVMEKKIAEAIKSKVIEGKTTLEQMQAAYNAKIITQEEYEQLTAALEARRLVIAVDDFASEELARINSSPLQIREVGT